MNRDYVNDALNEWNDAPIALRRQIDLQRDHYNRLIDIVEQHDWSLLFTEGVHIASSHGDVQALLSRIIYPIQLRLFYDPKNGGGTVLVKTLPSLLEEKLRSMGVYIGPIGCKGTTADGIECTCPFIYYINKEARTIQVVHA
jgi:hypothetical protein